MSEGFATLNFEGGEKQELRPDNTRLYKHAGKVACQYDHIFVVIDSVESDGTEGATEAQGSYIWAEYPPSNPIYIQLAQLAVQNNVEMHLNIIKVNKYDRQQFEKHVLGDLDKGIPEDWLNPSE